MKRFSARAQWFRKSVLAALGATVFGAIFLSQLNASAVILESDSQQCRVDVGSTSGVTLSLSAGRCFLTFSNVGSTTWSVPTGVTSFDLLVVAGGGGGGPDGGSGGGSGSMYEATVGLGSNSSPTFTVSIGAGGARGMHSAPPGQTLTAAGSGGSSTFSGALGFSVTTYGGGPGAWPSDVWVSGGAGGSTPAVSGGQVSLTSARALAGKTGAWARPSSPGFAGQNGVDGETSTLFGNAVLGSGGAGAMFDGNTEYAGGSGGAGGGGRGSGGSGTNGEADYFAAPGTNGTGGGGGGGARWGTTALLTIGGVQDHHRNGALGGSGIIRVSYAVPDLSIVTSGNGARVGVDVLVQPVLQLRNSADQNLAVSGVTVSIATNHGAISGNTAVSDANGRVTFTNLRFTSGTPGTTATLTFSAPGYLNITQTITVQTLASQINITTGTSSNGNFVNGVWFANTATASVINASALATELNARNVTIESQYTSNTSTADNDGSILFQADVNVTTSSERTVTFRAAKSIYFDQSRSLSSTNGKLNVVIWADTDSVNAGSVRVIAGSNAAISTNGGHLAIGGGSTSESWNGLTIPSGRAAGNNQFTGAWFGVELYANSQPLLTSSGGHIRIHGTSRNPSGGNVSSLHGVWWQRGLISTGAGSLSIDGTTGSDPSVEANQNFGVVVGADASSSFKASYLGTGGLTIVGSTATQSSDHRGVSVRYADFDAGASTVTISSDRRIQILDDVQVRSRLEVTSAQNVFINGSQSWTGSSGGKSAVITSTSGSVNVASSISSTSGIDFICLSGTFTSVSAGTISSGGDLSVDCSTVTLGGNITSAGHVNIEAEGASSNLTANANITLSTAGRNLTLKSKANVIAGSNGQVFQTAGTASGSGGRIVLWSDSDESGQGFIKTGRNITFNSIGGSTTTFTGGGDIHFGGGLDNGAATVVAGRTSGDGLPDGWAISNVSGEMGIWIGNLAASGDVNQMNSGGGKITIFGKNASASDALAFNWTSKVDSGQGQIEIRGDSAGWGVQLNRSGGNDTYSNKSVFTSRSNTHPAISIRGKSSGNSSYMALLGSYGDAGTDNLLIQAVGTGGVELIADGPANHPALGLQSTAVLSASGKITIDGGTSAAAGDGAIHFGSMYNGAAQGSVQLGGCAVSTCANSLVPTSTAEVDIIANRVATYNSLSTTVATSGDLLIVPAVGSTAFTDFAGRLTGLNLSSNLGGLQIGRPGDSTVFTLNKAWTIAGPITVHGDQLNLTENLVTTGANAPITLRSLTTIHINDSDVIQTNGSDIVLWASAAGASGQVYLYNNVCLTTNASCDTTITTTTGNIYLGGGSAGTNFPTGPVVNSSNRAVRLGHSGSGIKILAGGGISIQGQAPVYGIEAWQGSTIKARTGQITITGSSSGSQAIRVAGASGDTVITSAKTAGTAVSISGVSSISADWAIFFGDDDATVSATGGGDVIFSGTNASTFTNASVYLGRVTASAAAGGRVQVKAAGRIELQTSSLLTSGPFNGAGGEISIWSDSDNNDWGQIYINTPSCISTVSNCSATPSTGGSKIVIGGGAADSNDAFFPAGGAVANSTSTRGIQFGADHAADGVKIYSGGGDIRIASEQAGTLGNDHYGQLWYGGSRVHAGTGMVEIVNTASSSSASRSNYGVYLVAATWPLVITSEKTTGDAIRVNSTTNSTGNLSTPLLAFTNSSAVRLTIQATGGGNISMTGNTPSTGADSYSFDLNNVDLLASSGAIQLTGNRGFWLNRLHAGNNNFGATSSGSSTSNIELIGNRYVQNGIHANNFKTTGTVTIAPLDGASYLEDTTFPNSGNTFTGVTGLTFGNDSNTRPHTAGSALTGVTGPITFKTGNYTGTGSITTTSGPISILSTGTAALNANLSAGPEGILVRSVGRITGSAGVSGTPRTISTASGPITFWTTGAAGGVAFGNFTRLDSAVSGSGADITIGGGTADVNNPNRPGQATSSNADHGASLGTTVNANVFVVRAGSGAFSLSAAYTGAAATARAGIWLPPGQNIEAGTIAISGTTTYNALNDSTSSIDGYFSGSTAASEFHATKSFASKENAITIFGSSASNTGLALGPNFNNPSRFTIKASGTNAGISITGNSSNASATSGLWIAGIDVQTKNGDVLLDSGSRPIGLSSASRTSSYSKITGETGGNLTIRALGLHNSAAAFNINTEGDVLFTPQGTSFSGTQTFPTTGSTVTVGTLVVGSDSNASALTTGAAVTAAGGITYNGNGVTNAHNLTSTTGPIRLLSRGTISIDANLSSGTQGILARSEGRISTGAGTSGSQRTISTSSGPITFWTTGTAGGVTLNDYVHLNSNSSGTGGADITIGGGAADANDSSIPGGNAVSNASSGVILGSSNVDQIVRVSAGTGDVVIKGESTVSSNLRSGIYMVAGVRINGGTVDLFGKANNPALTDNDAGGIFHYQDSKTAKTVIEANKDFLAHSPALKLRGESTNGEFGLMLSSAGVTSGTLTTDDLVTLRTTGSNADIELGGSSSATTGYAVMLASVVLSTASGNVFLDGGDDGLVISRSSGTRKVAYTPVSGQPGGDVTLRTKTMSLMSTGAFNVTTAGVLTLEPPAGQTFSTDHTFPLTGSVIDVGGLVVGSANNTANLTQGAAITSSGDVTYLGGAQTGNFAITTSGSADIAFYPTTTLTKSTPTWSAGGDILIGTSGAPATTVSMSTSTLTAGGDVKIYSSQNVTQSAAISAAGGVVIDTSGATGRIDVDKGIAAGAGGILLKANQDILIDTAAKNITTSGGGDIVFWANASGNGGEVDTGGLSVVIDSNGGDIVIAGGADNGANGGTASDNIPDNSVAGRTANHTLRLMGLMDSDAGSIIIRAQHSAHSTATAFAAVYLAPTARIRSTTGDISIIGTQNSGNTSTQNQYGVWLGESTVLASRATVSSTSGDIFVSGDASQSDRNNRRGVILFGVNISTGGDVEIFGKAPSKTAVADVLTWTPSSITADGTTLIEGAGVSYLESTSIATGTGLTFKVGQLVGTDGLSTASFTSTPLSITGSGPVVIEPRGDSFTALQSLNSIDFATTVGSLRVGKASNTQSVTVAGNSKSISGSIDIIGSDIQLDTSLVSSSGYIYLKSDQHIISSAGTSGTPRLIQTTGNDITLHANSDGVGAGYIHLNNYTQVSSGSGAGDILLSGGVDPATGFAVARNDSTSTERSGITLGPAMTNTSYFAAGIKLTAGTGDVVIRGQTVDEVSGRGVAIPLAQTSGLGTIISGANVTIVGQATGTGDIAGVDIGKTSANQSIGSADVELTATDLLTISGSSLTTTGVRFDGSAKLAGKGIDLDATSPVTPLILQSTRNTIEAGVTGLEITLAKGASPSPDSVNLQPTSVSSTGPVNITFDTNGSTASLNLYRPWTITNNDVTITANRAYVGGALSAGTGVVTFTPYTANRNISVALVSSTSVLTLQPEALANITAETVRLTTGGDINIDASIDLTGKVNNLALRAGGNVTGSAGAVITVANLGIDAGGTINFPGNQVASTIALSATTITYNQTADYAVAAVDGIDPEFGYGIRFAIANVPVSGTLDGFMAVAFNPPPTVTIRDKFGNTLATNNTSAANYSVTAAFNLATTSSGAPVASGLTPTRSGGTFTFSDLKVVDGTGTGTFTFSATRNGIALAENSQFVDGASFVAQGTTNFTTATYNIQAGEPASIALSFTAMSAQAGKTGLAPTATLKDVGGNTIASGPHANAAITISIAGTDGSIVSGATATTTNGVASFPNLVLGGKVNTDYTLTFSVTYTNTQSQSVTVTEDEVVTLTFGDPAKVTLGAAAQTVANRTNLANIVATVRDAYDNVVTNSTASVALAFDPGTNLGESAVVTGYSAQNATAGVATFSGISLAAKADDYTVTASSGLLTSATQVVTVTHGIAHSIALTSPANATNDAAFGTQPVVRIYDQELNPVTTGAQAIQTVTLSATGATIGGTVSMPAVAGVADFTGKGVKLTGTIGSITLKAAIASPNAIEDTETITLGFGSATKLAITQAAAGFVNRTNFTTQPKVTVQDVSGNTVTNFTGDIELSIGSGATITGDTDLTLAAGDLGVASFTGLGLQGTIGSYTITASSTNLTSATQTGVALTHGAAAKVVVTAPANAQSNVVFGTQPIAQIRDADDNLVTTGDQATQVVTLTATGATLSGTNAQSLAMAAVAGEANFTGKGLKLEGELGTKTLTATISSPSSISGNASIELGFGEAVKLAITQSAAGFVNRTNFTTQPKVTVQDVSGNTVTNFTGAIELSIGSGATITGTRTLTLVAGDLGVASFTGLGLQGTIGTYTITASSDGLTSATQTGVALTHGAAASVELTIPATVTNDVVFGVQPQARILDADGNLVSTGAQAAQDVVLSSSNATIAGTLTQPAVGGVANFTGIKLTSTIGSRSITATIADPSATDTESTTVTFGSATKLAITQAAAGFVNRTNFTTQPKVTVQDVSGNTVTNFSGTISVAVSAGATLTGATAVTISASDLGVASYSDVGIYGPIATYTLTFSSGSLTSATQSAAISHGEAHSLELTVPATATNDVVFGTQPVVRILDEDGNLVSTGSQAIQTVTLSATGAVLDGTLSMPAVGGVANFTGKDLKLTGLIGPKPLKASISSPTAIEATSNITLQYGAATQLALTQAAAGFVNRTNFTTQPVVEVRDISGNAVTNYSGTVSIGVGSGANVSGTTSVTLTGTQSGLASFSGLGLYGAVGSYTLTYSSGSLTNATQSVSLTHGVATQLSVTTEADGARAGIEFTTQPVVKVLDQDSNVVTTGDASTSNIRVQSSGASLSGTLTALADQGVATFTNLKLSGTIGTYQLSYSALTPALAATFTAKSHDIELAPGVATEIHVTQQPTAVIAGEALSPVVSVQLRDAWQNVVTTDSTSTVKPVLVDASTEAVIDSSASATAVTNGAVSFTRLSFTSAGERKLKFESGAITKLSDSFTITHAAASQIVWSGSQPTAMRNDIAISPAPAFEIQDQFGNPALTGPRFTVVASVTGSNSGDVLSSVGTSQTQASNSAAVSFGALSLRAPAASYQLRFTATNGSTTFSVDSTSAIPLTFGNPTQLSIATQAATAGAGLAFGTQPVVHVLDSAGNLVSDSTLNVTASVSGRDLVGTATIAAASGIANFANSGLGINGAAANGLTLVFSAEYPSGTFFTTSQSINVTAGTATLISMIQQPTTLVTRESFSPAVSVELRDQFGNKVASDSSSTVSVVLYDSTGNPAVATSGQPALTSISTTSSQGVATFTGLSYAVAPGTGYYLRVTLNGFTISSGTFTVLPGAATSIEIDVQPSTTVGAGLTPTGELIQVMPEISLYDQDGYLATTTNGTATITATNSGDLSEGATSATVTNGQAEFSGIKLVGLPGQNYSLVFAFGSATKTSAAMQVTHNVATKIVLDRGAANGRSHEVFSTQPIVKILDRYNNLVTSGNDSSLDLRVVTSGGNVSGANISAQGGVGTFTGLSLGGAVNTDYTFTYEATFRQDIATATQTGVQVGYGFASQLRIHQEPVSLANGVLTKTGDALATQPVIHVTDNWGNIVENSSIQITASLLATQDVRDRLVSATATAVNGVATFNGLAMVVRPETDYKIRFAAGSLTRTSGNIQVRHGDATALRIVTQPSSVTGSGLTMTGEVLATTPVVEAIDFDGNRATSVNGDIATATVSVGNGEAVADLHSGGLQHNQASFSAGVAAFQNLKVVAIPGVEQKLAFGATIASTAVATPAASAGFTLTNNVAHQLSVLTQPCAGAVASSTCGVGITGDTMLVQPVIEIQDRYGNRVPEFGGEVSISTSTAGSSILVNGVANPTAQKATAVSGVATFSGIGLIALPSAQTQFSFTSPNLLSTSSANVVVAAAAPHKLVMATQPVGGRTGDALATQPVIRVLDRFDNHVLSDNATVVTASIASGTGGTLSSVAGTATAVGGVVTFTDLVFSGVPGANYTLGFGSGSLVVATSANFSVTNGLAAGLNFTSQPVGGKTGDLLSNPVELELLDDELNLAADDNSTVVTVGFAVTDGNARFVNSSDVTVTPSVTAVGGVVDFGDLRVVGTPGYEYKLVFTATPTSGPSYNSPHSAGFTLTHANPAQLVVTQSPVGGIVGGVLATQPTLRVQDRFGNHATSDNSTIVAASIYSGASGSIVSGGSATAVGGVVSFGAITASGTPGELYQLRFSATAANSATFSVDDTVGFRLSKTASLTFSYAAVAYAPDAIISPTFATDSPAIPVFTTNSSASVCELVLDPNTSAPNGQIRVKGVGSCVVTVTIPNAPFYSTISATETLVINKAQQAALLVTSANNVDYWSTMTPTASGGSGTGAVSFLVQGDCRIIGTTLIPGNAGSPCEITARKLGDANYQIAYSDPMDITINKIGQTPLRMANANTAAMIDLTLFTSGGSGTGAVTFQITTNRSVAGVEQCVLVDNDTKLRALSSGECGVSATKATSTNHLVAISPEQTVTFTKAQQRVNFTSSIPAMPLVGSIYTPIAVASSGLDVTYTITAGSGTICAWDTDPTKIKFLAAGSCEITATQVGDGQFSQASNTQTIVVNARNQTINFAEIANRTFGQPGFFLQANATSGLPVSFSVGSSAGSPACSITGGSFVNLLSAGSCEIIATQAGNQEYLAATPVKHIFTIAADLAGAPHLISISAGNQTVTASFNPPSYNGGAPITAYRLVATAANGDRFVNPGCPVGTGPISCTLVGVPNSQPGVLNSGIYTLKVAAITVAGIGNYSIDSRAITAAAGDMGVTNLIASPSTSSLTLDWDAPAALDSTFQQYEIYVWPLGGDEPETPTTTATATTATFSTAAVEASGVRRSLFSTFSAPVSLEPADAYEFKVVTITTQTQQADENLNTTFGMQQSFSRPGQPTQLQLQELPQQLSLGWSIPAFDGGKPILGYTVKVNGEPIKVDGVVKCEAITARICDFPEPRAGMTYEFEVFATNSIGDGPVATYSITMPAPPSTGEYVGPLVTHVMPNPAKPGALVVVVGAMLDIVETISIAGRELEFSIASSNALSVRLPANIAEGLYDLVITSSYGRLTVQDALVISLTAISPEPEIDSETDSGSGSGSEGDSGSESSGNNGSSGSGSTDSGSSGGESTDSGNGSGSEGNSGSDSDGSSGETAAPVPGDEDQSDPTGGLRLWWIPVVALVLAVIAARRVRAKQSQ